MERSGLLKISTGREERLEGKSAPVLGLVVFVERIRRRLFIRSSDLFLGSILSVEF